MAITTKLRQDSEMQKNPPEGYITIFGGFNENNEPELRCKDSKGNTKSFIGIGPAGADGKDGKTPNIIVGKTTTSEPNSAANVTSTIQSNDVILDFTIPRGQQGPAGTDGNNGQNGQNGTDGKSAYQIWVSYPDNQGKTEEEFVKELTMKSQRAFTFEDVTTGNLVFNDVTNIPVSITTNTGEVYPIQNDTITIQGTTVTINFKANLAAIGVSGVEDIWYVNFACGPGQIKIEPGLEEMTELTPTIEPNKYLKWTINGNGVINFSKWSETKVEYTYIALTMLDNSTLTLPVDYRGDRIEGLGKFDMVISHSCNGYIVTVMKQAAIKDTVI